MESPTFYSGGGGQSQSMPLDIASLKKSQVDQVMHVIVRPSLSVTLLSEKPLLSADCFTDPSLSLGPRGVAGAHPARARVATIATPVMTFFIPSSPAAQWHRRWWS